VFVVPSGGGASTRLSVTPTLPPGTQGIKRGSIRFTGPTLGAGVAWIQGTDSRTTPVVDAVALWNSIPPMGGNVLVRLTSAPTPGPRFLSMVLSQR
jgi:hypothetical protein